VQKKWLIAVDLDGTLFCTDHQISSRTLDTMKMVVDRGHSMVIVTGRSSHSSIPKLLSIPDGVRLVCSNGAYEYDRQLNAVVWAHCLPSTVAIDIQQRLLNAMPAASFGWESKNGLSYEPKFLIEAGGAHTLEQGGCFEDLPEIEVFKLFVRTPEKKGPVLAEAVQQLLAGAADVSSSGAPFVEITAPGVNKGSALARVASELGFNSNQTIAFGDNQNDVPMIRWAGESVAMGNAIGELRDLANAQTLCNSENGVAHYLTNKFLS